MTSNRCLLSILIPTYSYPEGLDKILSHLLSHSDPRVELIISDDSPDDNVNRVYGKYKDILPGIVYSKNDPPLGAVMNWNSLLKKANGDFILLMHHDEFPLKDTFISELINIIENNDLLDVILLKCHLVDERNKKLQIHTHNFLKDFILKNFLPFILTRNVIGPTSAFVFNKKLTEPFDQNLKWLVDVDFYYRVLSKSSQTTSGNIGIGSTANRIDSITSTLKNNIRTTLKLERAYLSIKYTHLFLWMKFRYFNISFIFLDFVWSTYRSLIKSINSFK